MAHNNNIGNRGEAWAVTYLQQKGYHILACNWRYRKAEVDIIAQYEQQLVVVEVKTRKSNYFGYPEQSVSEKKQALLASAAEAYCYDAKWEGEVRFDVIAITYKNVEGKLNYELVHIEDAFFYYDE